jgi:hypothetical protein
MAGEFLQPYFSSKNIYGKLYRIYFRKKEGAAMNIHYGNVMYELNYIISIQIYKRTFS